MCISIETDRLILRPWGKNDALPFAEMSQDKEVMRYFPTLLSKYESDALIQRIQSYIDQQGWGFWAIELKESGEFIGFTGLHHQPDKFEFSPCTEIGWRLKCSAWGKGFAFEAATASLNFGFNSLNLKEIVAFTAQLNEPSEKLMLRLGMHKIQNFEHPDIEEKSPLKMHVCYAITATEFNQLRQSNK
ncbi:GNAT family N-acetyltransferase [Acinetobacter shaoyimingii]|uniref:GNAT family N-acetyltransferase n=1 Tax=Acinetobacter shaoyimingii TaxID=2715164 RepID=A0A6G8RXC3_9GAMM|nr:GNAT family N-acetyltransferase [Acinetobacter shaoyimingii]QIO06500.1 GNAT family N-acetyltransferase [Acinetobacter shaoyimingii]